MSEWLIWMFVGIYYLAWDIKDWIKWLPLKLYVKWVLWRDDQLDALERWILRRKI